MTNNANTKPIALAITGASGAVYGVRLLERLINSDRKVELVISDAGKIVLKEELGLSARDLTKKGNVTLHGIREIGASIASGSYRLAAVVVCPCSSNTLGCLAQGVGDNLIARIGSVALKERWPLVVVPREAPYSTPLLENMRALSSYGAIIIPASPSFYRKPDSVEALVDTVVDRVLASLNLETILPAWDGQTNSKNNS